LRISGFGRCAPAVRTISDMPSGSDSSSMTSRRRLRSAAEVILRLTPPPARAVRHQHGEAAGERDVGRQRRALRAALLLDHLHQHDLPALDHLLDLVVAEELRRDAALPHVVLGGAADRLGRQDRLGRGLAIGVGVGAVGLGMGAVRVAVRSAVIPGGFAGQVVLPVRRAGILGAGILGGGHAFRRQGDALMRDGGLGGLGLERHDAGRGRVLVGIGGVAGHRGLDRVVQRGVAGAGGVLRLLAAAFLVGLGALGLQQALPVGDRDLVVVGVDLAEGEEAVPVAAVLDEGGLQAGLHPHDAGEVDVALEGHAVG
jgi:hypothetical protein